ncbi:hypothetical protein L6R29_24300, partial [Myxococcota bacterium]|nr:hypothetical protein [Myxococcota bacterium]
TGGSWNGQRLHLVHTACVMKKQNPRCFRLSLPPLFTGEGGVGGFPPPNKARMGQRPTQTKRPYKTPQKTHPRQRATPNKTIEGMGFFCIS